MIGKNLRLNVKRQQKLRNVETYDNHYGCSVKAILFLSEKHFSDGDERFISGGHDKKLRVFNLRTKKQEKVIKTENGIERILKISRNYFVTYELGRPSIIRLWNLETFEYERRFQIYSTITGICRVNSHSILIGLDNRGVSYVNNIFSKIPLNEVIVPIECKFSNTSISNFYRLKSKDVVASSVVRPRGGKNFLAFWQLSEKYDPTLESSENEDTPNSALYPIYCISSYFNMEEKEELIVGKHLTIEFRNLESGYVLRRIDSNSPSMFLNLENGFMIFAVGKILKVMDLRKRSMVKGSKGLKIHYERITGLSKIDTTAYGKRFLSCSMDSEIKEWMLSDDADKDERERIDYLGNNEDAGDILNLFTVSSCFGNDIVFPRIMLTDC